MHLCRLLTKLGLVFLALLFNLAPAAANTQPLKLADADDQTLSLTPYLEVLEDPTAMLTLSDVRSPTQAPQFAAQPSTSEALSFGFTRSAYWFRLTLHNPTDAPQKRMLEVANYALSYVDFYQPDNDTATRYRETKTGSALPFSSRAIKNRYFVFPVTVPADSQQVVYLRVQALDGLLVPAKLWSEPEFYAYSKHDYLGQSVYYGMVIAMVLFNLLLYIVLRDSMFLLYVCFESVFALALASFGGLAHEFLWPQATSWANVAHFVGWSGMALPLLLFVKGMMKKCIQNTLWNTCFNFIIAGNLLAIMGMLAAVGPFFTFSISLHSIGSLLFFGSVFYGMKCRNRPAYFLFISFSWLFIGGLMTIARGLGLLPSNFLTINGMQIGSALEMITLALALADRFNQIRQEKTSDQLRLLESEQALVKSLYENSVAQAKAFEAQSLATQLQSEALLVKAQTEVQQAHNAALQVQAELARKETEYAQTQLQQADKMASLGQLVASVTHEINTPIGAISSSGQSITEALSDAIAQLPPLLRQLDTATSHLLVELLLQANRPKAAISSREERAIIKRATEQLEAAGLDHARQKASFLLGFQAQDGIDKFLPLLQHPLAVPIQQAASNLSIAMSSARNVNVAVERVAKIVKALKSFSHFNIGTEKIEANLTEGMDTVLTIYQGQTRVGVEVVRNYEDMPTLNCYPDELNQVWTNLIHNALQAMNYEGVLTIGIRREGDNAVVSVGDSGCGIPEEIRSKIFDVFFTTKPAGVGSGLGLDIVKKIIEKHHGRIELESEEGMGTTFTVTLPYSA